MNEIPSDRMMRTIREKQVIAANEIIREVAAIVREIKKQDDAGPEFESLDFLASAMSQRAQIPRETVNKLYSWHLDYIGELEEQDSKKDNAYLAVNITKAILEFLYGEGTWHDSRVKKKVFDIVVAELKREGRQ